MMHMGVHNNSSTKKQNRHVQTMLAYSTVLNCHAVPSKLPDSCTEPIHTSFDLNIIYIIITKMSLPVSLVHRLIREIF
jgi:hypothetical protein